jgi:predicted alpha/beta-hydrolase family hydrolase
MFCQLAGRADRTRGKLPPQFGQRPPSLVSTQSRQNVHSNVQIMASAASGGRSLSQHSQFGRKASMV